MFTFLTANTAIGEVLKLPVLIHHYFSHQNEGDNENIIDFLVEHYGGNIEHHHEKNNHEHEHLPFKTNSDTLNPVSFYLVQPQFTIPKIISIDYSQKFILKNDNGYSDSFLEKIWQPPQFS